MTRKETLALYRPIRAELRRHLAAAQALATREEILAHAEALSILHDDDIVADDAALNMLADTVVFMPNPAHGRVIDRYVAGLTDQRERGFARRISKAMFSVWKVVGRHPLGGLVVDDAIRRRKRRHLMDEALAKSASKGMFLALRLFDAGPFSCAFGIVVPVPRLAVLMLQAAPLAPPHLQLLTYFSAIHGLDTAGMMLDLAEASQAA